MYSPMLLVLYPLQTQNNKIVCAMKVYMLEQVPLPLLEMTTIVRVVLNLEPAGRLEIFCGTASNVKELRGLAVVTILDCHGSQKI